MRLAKLVAARSLAVLSIAVVAGMAVAWGCGGSSSNDNRLGPGFYISISGMSFSPLDLPVPPGATVTVVNPAMEHSVTSETTAGAFTLGAVNGVSFDTGVFIGQKSFTIPSSATEGTVIPYFCRNHLGTMTTPTGTITIRAAATPAQPPGGGKNGGY